MFTLPKRYQYPRGISIQQLTRPIFILLVVLALVSSATPPVYAAPVYQEKTCSRPFEPVSPALTDLGMGTYTRMDGTSTEFQGGLYPGGSNVRPPEHEAAGLATAANIQPRNTQGLVDLRNGRIVMISIGMSNTSQEFEAFISLATREPRMNSKVFLLNGALGGRTAENWSDPASDVWSELERRLQRYSLTNTQVQVAWIKLTMVGNGEFPTRAIELKEHLTSIVQDLKQRFPNLAIVYLSSRTRSYTYWRGLSPEPTAFETGFAVKWLVEQQINGDPSLNFDIQRGEVKAPYLAWGPYLWADGQNTRADGFSWLPEDLNNDCTHPSMAGRRKIAELLLDFMLNDSSAAPWFRTDRADTNQTISTPTATQETIVTVEPMTINPEAVPTTPEEDSESFLNPTREISTTQPGGVDIPAGVQSKDSPAIPPLLQAVILSAGIAGLLGFVLGAYTMSKSRRR